MSKYLQIKEFIHFLCSAFFLFLFCFVFFFCKFFFCTYTAEK